MLRFDAKRRALQELTQSIAGYEDLSRSVLNDASELHRLRDATNRETIVAVERYVNTLVSSPKEFAASIGEYRVAIRCFDDVLIDVNASSNAVNARAPITLTASVALGAATMVAAPASALAIATTFGTASTGAAIATLSGAAQTSAALAWLGGGPVAASGGGMAVGANVLGILGGPLAWFVSGVAIAGASAWISRENVRIAQRANAESVEVEANAANLRMAGEEIQRLKDLTSTHADGVHAQLSWLEANASLAYDDFSESAKLELGALINNIRALTRLLNTQVS